MDVREKAYTFVTYTAVSFSFIAILAIFVTLPMANNYVTFISSTISEEMDYCQVGFVLIGLLSGGVCVDWVTVRWGLYRLGYCQVGFCSFPSFTWSVGYFLGEK